MLPTGDKEGSGWSVAHGAGRKWARTDARARLERQHSIESLQRTDLGGRVICEDKDLLFEEAPQAYKNIDMVIQDLVDAGLVEVVATLRPLITYKVRIPANEPLAPGNRRARPRRVSMGRGPGRGGHAPRGGAEGIDCKLLEGVPGDEEGTWKSALLALEGEGAEALAAGWEGTIQWIGKSPYRPNHKRKNWFVGVEVYTPPQRAAVVGERPADRGHAEFRPWRSARQQDQFRRPNYPRAHGVKRRGPRGAVPAPEPPAGPGPARPLLETQHADAEGQAKQRRWEQHGELERGNAVRVYEGPDFRARRRAGRG